MFIADAHLDLAYNARRGRDITQPAVEQPVVTSREPETATVGLPDLFRGNVGLVCGTIFCDPATDRGPGYADHAGARDEARAQMAIYDDLAARGLVQVVRSRGELPETTSPRRGGDPLPLIVLMEGADAIALGGESDAASAAGWFRAGVRMVGLAWGRTRYAGGTGAPGPLTDDGQLLVRELDAAGMIHDASHLAEQALDDLLDLAAGPVCASHSNCRAVVGDDPRGRHLDDRHIRDLAGRGGVIGVVLYDRFLLKPAELATRRAAWADVVRHVDHSCQLVGGCDHVGLGSDLDGGFGREHVPTGLTTAADLPHFADALSTAGYADAEVRKIMGENWRRFFELSLPA